MFTTRRTVSLVAALALSGSVLAACGTSDATAPTAAVASAITSPHASHAAASAGTLTPSQAELYKGMRTLWAQHMAWTWNAVVAFASDSPGLQATIDRLLRNQADIGAAIAPVYGKEAGDKLTELLKRHITDAVPVLTAAKAGDKDALTKAVNDWYANADEIADFLAKANPNWGQDDMRAMMKTHITQTVGYASDVLGGKYADAITKYDEAEQHMTEMADMLSAGVIAQFPDKFAN